MDSLLKINPEDFLRFYPSLYLIAVYTGIVIILYEIYRRKLPLLPILVTMVWGLIFAIWGSKLFTITPTELLDRIKTGSPLSHERVYIGWLIGGMIGIKIFRKILGFKFDLFDIFAFSLPAGFALIRIGCLLAGCCFGKPANLLWAICYTQHSLCYNYHLHSKMVSPDALLSLPVHPAQVYEIIAMIIIISLLIYLRNHLKKPGSLGYLYLVLHSIFRFFIDFFKEGGTYVYGLKLMQWFLLFFIPIGILFIRWREQNTRVKSIYCFEERTVIYNLIVFLPALIFLFFPQNWLTPAEYKVLLILNIIAVGIFLYEGIKYLCHHYRILIRIPFFIASMAILETSLDTQKRQDTLKSIFYIDLDGGYMKGSYEEFCNGVVPYEAGGIGITTNYKDAYDIIYGLNLKGHICSWNGHDKQLGYAANFILNHKYLAFNLGMGRVNFSDRYSGYPSLGLRLGPRNKVFVEGMLLNHSPADVPSPIIKLGWGIGSGGNNETNLRFGISDAGFYTNPNIYFFDNRLRLSPFLILQEKNSYQINFTVGYRYYFKDKKPSMKNGQ